MSYTDKSLRYLKTLREETDLDWQEITEEWNEKFAQTSGKRTLNALRKTYRRYQDDEITDDTLIKNIKSTHTAKKTANKLRKENKALVENLVDFDEIQEGIEKLVENVKCIKYKPPKKSKAKKKLKKMTIEALVSDIHYGLKTKTYSADVTRSRMRAYTAALINDKRRYEKNYNIEKFLVQLNGDIIQSATMHKDSGKSCHLTNAEQLAVAIESLFYDLLLPVALEGEEVEVIGMGGNHDRESSERFTVDPGTSYYTYTIYRSLELLCKASGLTNVKFIIPVGAYHIYEVYGFHFDIEHGDLLKTCRPDSLENHLMKRAAQVGKILSGIRIGHFHNDYVGSLGRHIVNGSTVSDDHYGDGLGYVSRPAMIINYYVETTENNTSYYHSLVVNLG